MQVPHFQFVTCVSPHPRTHSTFLDSQGAIVALIGVAALIFGALWPGLVRSTFENEIDDMTYPLPGSQAIEDLEAPPKKGLADVQYSSVGSIDLDADQYEDTGIDYFVHVSGLDNDSNQRNAIMQAHPLLRLRKTACMHACRLKSQQCHPCSRPCNLN